MAVVDIDFPPVRIFRVDVDAGQKQEGWEIVGKLPNSDFKVARNEVLIPIRCNG